MPISAKMENICSATGDYIDGYKIIGFEISDGVIRFGINGCNVENGTIIRSTFMTVDDLSVTKY